MGVREKPSEARGVWFVYDGECPVCSMAAHALRIRQEYGPLHLIDARTERDHPLVVEAGRRSLSLDEGMAIFCNGQIFHGKDALRFMAQFAEPKGWFNRVSRAFFRSRIIARVSYPWMRSVRNLLLRAKGVDPINNLSDRDAPLFKSVFGEAWEQLPTVLKRHYANRPYRDDTVTVEGLLDVVSSPLGRLLRPGFRLARALAPYEGKNVPVTVNFVTNSGSNAFRFERMFRFTQGACEFRSAMIPVGKNELVEMMGMGLGWRMAYTWDGSKVILAHRGYVWRVFGFLIPLPLTLLMGAGYAEETAIDDDEFEMTTEIRHPWWGRVFGYAGRFRVTKDR